jgi:hypothetical protein
MLNEDEHVQLKAVTCPKLHTANTDMNTAADACSATARQGAHASRLAAYGGSVERQQQRNTQMDDFVMQS